MINFKVQAKVKTFIKDVATGRTVKESPDQANLVLNQGLNALANSGSLACTVAGAMGFCLIGSGSTPNSTASGAITFTQAAFIITASAGFFTPSMVGQLFKYGVGSSGAEYYITGYTSSTVVTVNTSATVDVAEVATVWAVNQTGMAALSFASNSYQSNVGDNETTYGIGYVDNKRTYVFAQQGSPYTVNEVGYSSNNTNPIGRIVLGSGDVVGTSNFYVVVITFRVTMLPVTPTSVADVGTGFNTAGTAMLEAFGLTGINNNSGNSVDATSNTGVAGLRIVTANYSQRANTLQGLLIGLTVLNPGGSIGSRAYVGGTIGVSRYTGTFSTSTSGQTCYGIALFNPNNGATCFDVLLTTPVVLPTGTFSGSYTITITFGRTLTN